MEIIGKVVKTYPVFEGTSASGKNWKLFTFVIETQEQYPRHVAIEVFGEERIKVVTPVVGIDEIVSVSYDLESREYNGRWYTSVRAWKVDVPNNASTNEQTFTAPTEQSQDQSGLPF